MYHGIAQVKENQPLYFHVLYFLILKDLEKQPEQIRYQMEQYQQKDQDLMQTIMVIYL